MERFELIVPCHFGLEAVMKREITDLGYEVSQAEDAILANLPLSPMYSCGRRSGCF